MEIDMPGDWILCPRCELNYIKKGEDYCEVCKAELNKGPQLLFAVDDDELDEEQEGTELCARCRINYVKPGEDYCESCLKFLSMEEPDVNADDDSWKEYMDDEEEEEEESEESNRNENQPNVDADQDHTAKVKRRISLSKEKFPHIRASR